MFFNVIGMDWINIEILPAKEAIMNRVNGTVTEVDDTLGLGFLSRKYVSI